VFSSASEYMSGCHCEAKWLDADALLAGLAAVMRCGSLWSLVKVYCSVGGRYCSCIGSSHTVLCWFLLGSVDMQLNNVTCFDVCVADYSLLMVK
jgi:hypothetical protein